MDTILNKYKNNITAMIIEKSVIKRGNEFRMLKLKGINVPFEATIMTR